MMILPISAAHTVNIKQNIHVIRFSKNISPSNILINYCWKGKQNYSGKIMIVGQMHWMRLLCEPQANTSIPA